MAGDGLTVEDVNGMDSIEKLVQAFEALDCSDRVLVARWLKRMFELCGEAKVRVPNSHRVLERIEFSLGLKPDQNQPGIPPKDDRGWFDWVIVLCLNNLITPYDDFYIYYRTDAEIISLRA